LPLTLAIGFLRPHLFDLELVIRKSVVYGLLWLLIALAYVGMAVFVGVATTRRYEVGVVVLVTILATIAFQPVRALVERLASRLVYGERLSGYQAVSRLGSGLEAAAPEMAAAMVAATVRQALDAKWARVVIEGPNPILAVDKLTDTTAAEATLMAPLVYGEEVAGRVECGPRSEGRYRPRDTELLITLARHAALAIRNATLAAELADRLELINVQAQELHASRARIVHAEETGRRRLERDIHDGVQQELVALLAKIRRARNQLGRDPATVNVLLEELQEETKLALSDLRDFAQGIHPTVLSDRGLAEAIADRVSRLPASVSLEVTEQVRSARFAQAVEGAAYFTVCEGLANAMKHASARRLIVRLGTAGDDLVVEVTDDGAGFEMRGVKRSGLSGLADRIEALGGRFQVTSLPGRGTQLHATLPARATAVV
jgi:signal transduction histidine kinase